MRKMGALLVFVGLALFFFFAGSKREEPLMDSDDQKQFALIFYAHNRVDFCEKMLRSVFEQDHGAYRVLFLDDASVDGTFEQVQRFCLEQNQEDRVVLMRSEERIGPLQSLLRAVEQCKDSEIILPLEGWLSHSRVLSRINRSFQNRDVWAASCQVLEYPSYQIKDAKEGESVFPPLCLYVEAFRSLDSYPETVWKQMKGHLQKIEEPLLFTSELRQTPKLKVEPAGFLETLPCRLREFFQ